MVPPRLPAETMSFCDSITNDQWIWGFLVHFGGASPRQIEHVARELDTGRLHARYNPPKYAGRSRAKRMAQLAFKATFAEGRPVPECHRCL
jgi:hypothetical protein